MATPTKYLSHITVGLDLDMENWLNKQVAQAKRQNIFSKFNKCELIRQLIRAEMDEDLKISVIKNDQ